MRGLKCCLLLLTLSTLLFINVASLPAAAAEPLLVRVAVADREAVSQLNAMGLDITTVRPGEYLEAYVTPKEKLMILVQGYEVWPVPDTSRDYLVDIGKQGFIPSPGREWTSYPTYTQLGSWLADMEAAYPAICDLFTVGQSVAGRELWVVKISDNVTVEEAEPEFKYISSMHGNEILGVPLCLNLIELLLTNYGTDPELTQLVDNREIYIMPLMNPDGYTSGSRYNQDGVDLNRDFPDFITDPVNTIDGRAVETANVMLWQEEHTFVLSANFHTGALVVNYPWDSTYDFNPDDTFFYNMSLGYSVLNPPMWNSPYFTDGVVRGCLWYVIHGGMQDWNYYWYADFDVTIELSNSHSVPASQIDDFWDENREAMLYLIDLSGKGVTGTVTDSLTGLPVDAQILVSGIDMPTPVNTDPDHGNYVRPLFGGNYDLTFSSYGYYDQTVDDVPVVWEEATVYDIQLVPMPPDPDLDFHSLAVDDSVGGNGNGIIEPGETVDLSVTLVNAGFGSATGISAVLSEDDEYITITQDTSTYPDIPEQQTGACHTAYTIQVDPLAPELYAVTFTLDISADGGLSDTDSFQITISGDVFRDDMESGDDLWSHYAGQGTDDWAIVTEASAHSPTHCWFSTDAHSTKDDYLITDPFTLPGNGELTFWHRYNMESDWDGCVIEISMDGGDWTDLGPYISSGGYNSTLNDSENPLAGRQAWSGNSGATMTEVVVDLSSFPGPNTALRFRLGCDSSVDDEGWYVDDVLVTGQGSAAETVSVGFSCLPAAGTVPFVVNYSMQLINLSDERATKMDAWIDVATAGGIFLSAWKSGSLTIGPAATMPYGFSATLPAHPAAIGINTLTLVGVDVTPPPYNQPPYPPSGDSATDGCTVEGVSP